tara:strand:- start:3720 stop:3878 length:159 start_codon:yes stop_codon:yes gene_type:complete
LRDIGAGVIATASYSSCGTGARVIVLDGILLPAVELVHQLYDLDERQLHVAE